MREAQNIYLAKRMRSEMTDAEKKLWYRLRAHRFCGFKFRRQYSIGPFITDFACIEQKLIIELDGGQHAMRQSEDQKRSRFLQQQGFTILRIWNNEVLQNVEGVLEVILAYCTSPLPDPLPQAGEGKVALHD